MMNNNKNGIRRERRFTTLEQQVGQLQKDVTEIRDNHLAHLYERVHKMDKKLAYYVGGLAVLAFVAPLLVRILF